MRADGSSWRAPERRCSWPVSRVCVGYALACGRVRKENRSTTPAGRSWPIRSQCPTRTGGRVSVTSISWLHTQVSDGSSRGQGNRAALVGYQPGFPSTQSGHHSRRRARELPDRRRSPAAGRGELSGLRQPAAWSSQQLREVPVPAHDRDSAGALPWLRDHPCGAAVVLAGGCSVGTAEVERYLI